MTRETRTRTARKQKAPSPAKNGANLGFEAKLWAAADKLRNNVDPAEYKHVVMGLIFLKYISDAFEERRAWIEAATRDPDSDYHCRTEEERRAVLEDRDEYLGENVFWVPAEARWSHLQAAAKQPTIGKLVDDAMAAIERENPTLRGVLPKDYARPTLDKHTLGELIDLVGTIGLGDAENLLAIRGIEGNLGPSHADSFRNDQHPDLRADFILANPPFNVSDWKGELLREDARWQFGVPPVGNANFAWVQHFIHHLAPNGVAGFVLDSGSINASVCSI